jgi:hypothetical protein
VPAAEPPTEGPRRIAAPELRETAEIWWDAEVDPLVVWDARGAEFRLVDGADPANSLLLLRADGPVDDAGAVGRALAEGLAACDFPPTGEGASPNRVAATLRVAGLDIGPAGGA